MRKTFYDQINSILEVSGKMGLGHLTTDIYGFPDNSFKIKEKKYINFSLCDYLALSQDERIKQGAINAIINNGVYTAISKSYVKLKIYEDAEDYLYKLFNRPVVLFPRTTLAHTGVLPVITNNDDAIILDHQVHTSARMGADLVKCYGSYVETIRHNRVDVLEERIKFLKNKYRKVWYLADSIYSMYGDTLPHRELFSLLERYDQFHLYVDDAHGMSWTGENGKGFILNNMPFHPHLFLVTSLGKGFGAGGGAVVCYDDLIKKRLINCSVPLIFTSPVTPSTLGAIIESAKIHLSSEIYERQIALKTKIDLFHQTARGLGLPILSDVNSVIAFIAAGKPDMCREICVKLMDEGYYASAAHFPAVPLNNSGIRAVISLYQTNDDIINMLKTLKEIYDNVMNNRNLTQEDILKHYKTYEMIA